jgi:spermidine/putrescine-binding protein
VRQLRKRTTTALAKADFVKGGCRTSTLTPHPSIKNIFHGEFLMRTTRTSHVLLLCGLACAVAACGKKEQPAPAAPQNEAASTALEGQVDIVAWPGYIERGESDKNYDWVTKFETDTGCKVNVKTAGTSDEMLSLMKQGGKDHVTA